MLTPGELQGYVTCFVAGYVRTSARIRAGRWEIARMELCTLGERSTPVLFCTQNRAYRRRDVCTHGVVQRVPLPEARGLLTQLSTKPAGRCAPAVNKGPAVSRHYGAQNSVH